MTCLKRAGSLPDWWPTNFTRLDDADILISANTGRIIPTKFFRPVARPHDKKPSGHWTANELFQGEGEQAESSDQGHTGNWSRKLIEYYVFTTVFRIWHSHLILWSEDPTQIGKTADISLFPDMFDQGLSLRGSPNIFFVYPKECR